MFCFVIIRKIIVFGTLVLTINTLTHNVQIETAIYADKKLMAKRGPEYSGFILPGGLII